MEIWEKRLVNNVPTICYWTTVREYLLINCCFIRGQRVGHWPLTLNLCNELCPWFFAFGHTNYARWLPVFLKDMAKLPEVHPAVHAAFMEGMCVVQRGDKKCYCGSSRYGSGYTYHITSACQYFWRVHTYAAEIGYGIGKTCKDIPIHHISQIKCLDLNIVKCCPSSMLSQGAM